MPITPEFVGFKLANTDSFVSPAPSTMICGR